MNFDWDNNTILIIGLVVVSIVALYCNNELIVTTIVGALAGFLAKDKINDGVDDDETA